VSTKGLVSLRTGEGDVMLLPPELVLLAMASYQLQSYLQTSRCRSRAAEDGMIGKSKASRTMTCIRMTSAMAMVACPGRCTPVSRAALAGDSRGWWNVRSRGRRRGHGEEKR
jgi:hypothetical protein